VTGQKLEEGQGSVESSVHNGEKGLSSHWRCVHRAGNMEGLRKGRRKKIEKAERKCDRQTEERSGGPEEPHQKTFGKGKMSTQEGQGDGSPKVALGTENFLCLKQKNGVGGVKTRGRELGVGELGPLSKNLPGTEGGLKGEPR